MSAPVITFCGDDALRFLVDDSAERLARAHQLRDSDDWTEVVPGRGDITVQFNPHKQAPATALERLSHTLEMPAPDVPETRHTIVLPIHFGGSDGPDLADICAQTGLSKREVISCLLRQPLQVEMLGFTPGFAYLSGLDATIQIPRLNQPRQQVPAGSIGLITGQCGLYALAGPGGWPIIGRTFEPLFDAASQIPFQLMPGMQIQFVDVKS
jgi:KipI family sensor histidine kinase inhibitor